MKVLHLPWGNKVKKITSYLIDNQEGKNAF